MSSLFKSNLVELQDYENNTEDFGDMADPDPYPQALRVFDVYTQQRKPMTPLDKRLLIGMFYSKYFDLLSKDVDKPIEEG